MSSEQKHKIFLKRMKTFKHCNEPSPVALTTSGRDGRLLCHPSLRTERATFAAHRSSSSLANYSVIVGGSIEFPFLSLFFSGYVVYFI